MADGCFFNKNVFNSHFTYLGVKIMVVGKLVFIKKNAYSTNISNRTIKIRKKKNL